MTRKYTKYLSLLATFTLLIFSTSVNANDYCTKSSSDGGLNHVTVKPVTITSGDIIGTDNFSIEAWKKAAKQAQKQFGGEISHDMTAGVSITFHFKVSRLTPPVPKRFQIQTAPDKSLYKSIMDHHAQTSGDVKEEYPCQDVTEAEDLSQQNSSVYPPYLMTYYDMQADRIMDNLSSTSAFCPYPSPYSVCSYGDDGSRGTVYVEHIGES
ncbi:hypothetical protein [Marinimicrobium sp. C2-29]|uniref:hypothetical protein n=1 Tax=Marinimicrobium sp. C2-29 TaxID=3139825 RepID=UPI00313A17FC